MSGVVSFLIKVVDGASTPLANIVQSSKQTSGVISQLTNSTQDLQTGVDITGMSVNTLRNRISKLQEYRDILPANADKKIRAVNTEINRLNGEIQNLTTKNGGAIQTWAKDAFMKIPDILRNPLTLAGAGVVGALNQGMSQSREKFDFKLLLGDNLGSQLYDQLKTLKPLLGESVQTVAKDLLGVGITADKVKPMIEQLGAVARGDESKFTTLAGAFKELQKEGKLTENTLATMNSVGFKPLHYISQKYGMSMSDLQQKLQAGQLDVGLVAEALQTATGKGGDFADVLTKLGKEPSVVFSVLTQKVTTFAAEVGIGLINALTGAYTWMKENKTMLEILGTAVVAGTVAYYGYKTIQELVWLWQMRSVVAESLHATSTGLLTVLTGGLTVAQTALNAAFFASPIGWIVGGFALIGGAVVWAWNKFEGFREVVYGVWESVKTIFDNISEFFAFIFGEKDTLQFKDVGESFAKGVAEEAERNKKRKEEEAKTNAGNAKHEGLLQTIVTNGEGGKPTNKPDGKVAEGINAVSGGGAKVVNIQIGKMVERLEIKVTNGTQQMAKDLEQAVEEILVRALASANAR